MSKPPEAHPRPVRKPAHPALHTPRLPTKVIKKIPLPAVAVVESEKKSDLEIASGLANRGRLQEAADLCVAYLREHADSAQAHYLLGLTRDASGDEKQAMAEYRRAIYLDPKHGESLAHLASLLEKHGDSVGAKLLYSRANRIHQSSKPK